MVMANVSINEIIIVYADTLSVHSLCVCLSDMPEIWLDQWLDVNF